MPAFTVTMKGLQMGDGVSAPNSRITGETMLGSPYTINAVLSPAGVLTNYTITYNTAAFNITPKAASVTPDAVSKEYGSADPAFTGTLTGFLGADGVTATYSRTAGETVASSPYTISAVLSPAGVLSKDPNTSHLTTIHINTKQASVSLNKKSKEYGSAYPAFT